MTDGSKLYFTDSETSAVRTADTSRSGRVATIVGQHLFTFGDVDSVGDEVRLQHPLGIDLHDGVLYVTDTYNDKEETVFPATRGAVTLLGTGSTGHEDGPGLSAEFDEPGGISVVDGKLYIADTNNHAIRTADLAGCEVTTLGLNEI